MGVFNADSSAPVVLKAGKAIVSVNGSEMLALNVQIQFQRQVEMVPVLGNKRVVSIGEPTGTFTCDSLVANSSGLSGMGLDSDGCSPFTMTITMNDGACDASGKTITCSNCFASAVTVNAQGGRGYIAEGIQVTFTAMEV